MELLVVSLKNVFRNRRRTTLTVIALTVGVAVMLIGMAWIQGYQTYIYDALIRFQTGHLHVLPERYLDESERLPVDITVADYANTREDLLSHTAVEEAAGRINFSARIAAGRKSTRLLGKAIDPAREARITVIEEHIVRGSYLTDGSGVLLGEPIARKMGLEPGDSIYVRAMDRHGVENVTVQPLVGTFEYGYPAMDNNVFFTDLESASELLSLEDQVTRVVLGLSSGAGVRATQRELSDSVGEGLTVEPWTTFVQSIVSATRVDMATFWGILVILYLMIILGILNSMSMSVQERTGEIATMRAIGMRRGRVLRLFLAESVWTAVLGLAAGGVVAAPLLYHLQHTGIPIGEAIPESLPIPFGRTFRSNLELWHILVTAAAAGGTALLGSLLPALRASKVNIARALSGKR